MVPELVTGALEVVFAPVPAVSAAIVAVLFSAGVVGVVLLGPPPCGLPRLPVSPVPALPALDVPPPPEAAPPLPPAPPPIAALPADTPPGLSTMPPEEPVGLDPAVESLTRESWPRVAKRGLPSNELFPLHAVARVSCEVSA